MMQYEWEKYDRFTDDSGTYFVRLDDVTYEFTTIDGDTDTCTKQQLIDWNVQIFTYEK